MADELESVRKALLNGDPQAVRDILISHGWTPPLVDPADAETSLYRSAKTVKQVREELAQYPDYYLVIMAKDAEGNGFSPLHDTSEDVYTADTTYSGELEPGPGHRDAVVLWPVN